MTFESTLRSEIAQAVEELFGPQQGDLVIQPTNQEFAGTHTLVCFPLTRVARKKPEEIGKAIGDQLLAKSSVVKDYNVVKGFLNLTLRDEVWIEALISVYGNSGFGQLASRGEEIMVEYSSPNTNKPLHLGHLRNNFLGWSVAEIYKANGYTVHKVQIINDRGIHICKSMAAWTLYGEGETPETSGIKGDHLVGKYYVTFDKVHKAQVKALMEKGASEEEATRQTPIMKLAVEMLQKWEQKDPDTVNLWETMNAWVYEGFNATYSKMGVDFDKLYYESDTYLLGRDEVMKGLERGVFFRKEDGSVWVDLTDDGLDEKLLLRADGTSVYMTQDIGTAILRFRDFPRITGQIYTVGNEQEYHFKVLFLILDKLGYDWAKHCYHLSYGMVDLPSGRMKSREGTVVDADDLIEEMVAKAEKQTRELGKLDEVGEDEARKLFHNIALGALKFFLLKVDPKKRMLFDPTESIQLQGFTGPFVQYTHARICSILRKATSDGIVVDSTLASKMTAMEAAERDVLRVLVSFENRIREAAREYSPAIIANYAYDLAKAYNQFYQSIPIFAEAEQSKVHFRLALSSTVAAVIKRAMHLLGIEVPEKM